MLFKKYPGENRGERLGEFESRSVKTRDVVKGFHLLENSYKVCHPQDLWVPGVGPQTTTQDLFPK